MDQHELNIWQICIVKSFEVHVEYPVIEGLAHHHVIRFDKVC